MSRPLPDLLSPDEEKALLETAERVWRELQENRLGGYSGGNRPFWILAEFKAVIERFGYRDIGQTWTRDELVAASKQPEPEPSIWRRLVDAYRRDRYCQCPPPFIPQRNGTCGVCARPE